VTRIRNEVYPILMSGIGVKNKETTVRKTGKNSVPAIYPRSHSLSRVSLHDVVSSRHNVLAHSCG
jgi:hypothetical protein